MAVNPKEEDRKQGIDDTSGAGLQLLAFTEVLLLSLWLGSMVFFSFAVAPSAFAVLPTRELAGALVTSTIAKVEMLGLITGPLLLLLQAVNRHARRFSSHGTLRAGLILAMIATAALSHFWISPTMVSLRAAMGGNIDDVPANHPMRAHFNELHQYSVALMGVAIVAGVLLLFLTVRSWLKSNRTPIV